MHPPKFRLEDKLSDWPDCHVELRCCHLTDYPVKLMIQRHGDCTFKKMLSALRCKQCRRLPAPVYLVAGFHREECGAGLPDWSLELVPKQRPLQPYGEIARENLKQRNRTDREVMVFQLKPLG